MVQTQTMTNAMRPPVPAEPGAGVYSNKLGMWAFLASDVMFFTALISSHIELRFRTPSQWRRAGRRSQCAAHRPEHVSVDLLVRLDGQGVCRDRGRQEVFPAEDPGENVA